MSDHVWWIVELDINPNQLENFQALANEMVTSAQAEPGTLMYEYFFNADNTVCHACERYDSSEAMLKHTDTFGKRFAARFFEAVSASRCVVYGTPSDAVRKEISGLEPVYMTYLSGFAR